MQIKAPRGTHDVLPHESYKWHTIENTIKELCQDFDYKEIRTPVIEVTELFSRGYFILRRNRLTFRSLGGIIFL